MHAHTHTNTHTHLLCFSPTQDCGLIKCDLKTLQPTLCTCMSVCVSRKIHNKLEIIIFIGIIILIFYFSLSTWTTDEYRIGPIKFNVLVLCV